MLLMHSSYSSPQDTYGNYAELRHTAIDYIKEGHPKADDIDVQREYMDTVCRSFASRLERRRNMVICSTRFHRFAEEVCVSLVTIVIVLFDVSVTWGVAYIAFVFPKLSEFV